MLYAWLPRPRKGGIRSISAEEVAVLLATDFEKMRTVIGEEKGHPSAWVWFQRRVGDIQNRPKNIDPKIIFWEPK